MLWEVVNGRDKAKRICSVDRWVEAAHQINDDGFSLSAPFQIKLRPPL